MYILYVINFTFKKIDYRLYVFFQISNLESNYYDYAQYKKNKNGNNNRMIEKYDYNKAILVIKLFFTNLKNKLRTKEKKLLMKSTGNILELN
ncbi:hypothetical protein DERP_004793 [Dermatophagoides pteronyssinus]|uniref:Uncharacterized protein n=1 Tax=Dermatophagoides pteronyssinus TaxID=6956 RepID=A0ABQ8JSL6_DERPT|nr:hypothetical protein DERP_004793 [Dermatophagoides pteronyssinus]